MAGLYDTTTISKERSSRTYKDLNLSIISNPATKDIAKLKDVEAVKRSVRNLVELNHFEKPFHPEIGSDIRNLLFENMTPITHMAISRAVEDLINAYEPRAKLLSVSTNAQYDNNSYEVTINFQVIGTPEPITVQTMLERVR